MISKRMLLRGMGALICVPGAKPARAALPPISMETHERYMRLAIEQGKKNAGYPFGAVIVKPSTGEVMAAGVNSAHENPVQHGEIVCMNDYVAKHGNKGWQDCALYTTGEPCPMCMTALVWANIGTVIYASSSFEGLKKAGWDPIKISAQDVVNATPFNKIPLVGGVLAAETDLMFLNRKKY